MITVIYDNTEKDFETLDLAMDWAKMLGKFVTIRVNGMEFVGHFGVDGVVDGKCPDGIEYSWKKRRL